LRARETSIGAFDPVFPAIPMILGEFFKSSGSFEEAIELAVERASESEKLQ